MKVMMIFLSYVKMHFFYVKSNILRKWSNILRNYVHSRTFFIPKIHPLQTTRPTIPPCLPPRQASHLTLPATPPGPPPDLPSCQASHPTRPANPPCHPTLPACRRRRSRSWRCDALVPSSASCKGRVCGVQVNVQPPPIFCTPPPKFSMYPI